MLVFIAESGDTGLELDRGATKFFGIFMVVFEEHDEATACDQRIGLLRKELNLPDDFEFHFHRNSKRVREVFLKAVLPYQFFYYGVVINKAKLFGDGFRNKESFYKYASNLLFQNSKEKLVRATVVIDESGREKFRYELAQYLRKKMNDADGLRRIHKVKMQDSKRNNLLQLADMVAGAVTRSLDGLKRDTLAYRKVVQPREMYVQFWPK